ncbi:electron transfer flavoprotein subunit beta/FixA family protein [Dehalobacter sp. DCM]|uniref:electron transfer flavoprotein subunit beta/FixA family protein n=1 Tax=Dehalobacter sp. DCM TaxID=2907827 RepID=UPI003081DD02|nr:electron transfer flavoprotein subunit beta/FixA family protein [Dehalobacter sp. DCM]
MEIVVCIKQVPDTTEVKIDPVKNTLIRDGVPSIVNPFDEYATEAAIRIKEQVGGKVSVLTMGPPQAGSALRKCLAMGADEGILISDRAVAGADTWATSYTLAKAIEKIGKPDIIFCGKMAIDGDTAQVGPGIAEHLGLPQTTYVQKIREIHPDHLVVERAFEGGFEVIKVKLPAVIAVDKAIGEPRYPSVKGSIKASRAPITTWSAADIGAPPDKTGLNGSCTQVMQIFTPEVKFQSEMLQGSSPEELCDQLIGKLKATELV